MNLFARSLGIPLEMLAAAEAIAGGEVVPVDIGEVNGSYFVHHVTLGLHARMILLRARIDYTSRLGKIWASVKAWWMAVRNPPSLDARIRADGKEFRRRTAAILVTNNPLGEGHLPYADDPRRGHARALCGARAATGRTCCAGRWHAVSADSPPIRFSTTGWRAKIDIALAAPKVSASVDGEIVSLETPLRCRLHRGGLRVLRPREALAQRL